MKIGPLLQTQDQHVLATCPVCNVEKSLAGATVTEEGESTVYRCRSGCGILAIVAPVRPGAAPWNGRGYRLGDHVIRNVVDLRSRKHDQVNGILIPASPNALEGN